MSLNNTKPSFSHGKYSFSAEYFYCIYNYLQ